MIERVYRNIGYVLAMLWLTQVIYLPSVCADSDPRQVRLNRIPAYAFAGTKSAWLVSEDRSRVFFTHDTGSHWTETTVDFGKIDCVTFLDTSTGWLVSSAANAQRVYATTDGGSSWKQVSRLAGLNLHAEQIEFTDRLHGWMIAPGKVLRSRDGGVTWEKVLPLTDQHLRPVRGAFIERNAWICDEDGSVYISKDGGDTWRFQTVNRGLSFVNILFVNSKTGWLQTPVSETYLGVLYRTDDGGESWELQPALPSDLSLLSVSFVDSKTGWGVGQATTVPPGKRNVGNDASSATTVLSRTSDGGNSWQSVSIDLEDWVFWGIHFRDAQHAWLIGADNLYYTENQGKNWRPAIDLRQLVRPSSKPQAFAQTNHF